MRKKDKKKYEVVEAKITADVPIEEILQRYLQYVFREEHFIIGLDCTGCYLFSEDGTDEEIMNNYKQLLEDLKLTANQACVCVVGRKSSFNYCSKGLLEKYISKATKARKSVLSRNDISEILEVYEIPVSADSFYYLDFSNTHLFQKIKNAVAQHGQSIDDDSVSLICRMKPKQVSVLQDLGVPDVSIPDVLKLLYSSEEEHPIVSKNRVHSNAVVDEETLVPRRSRRGIRFLQKPILFLLLIVFGYIIITVVYNVCFGDKELLSLLDKLGRKLFGGM